MEKTQLAMTNPKTLDATDAGAVKNDDEPRAEKRFTQGEIDAIVNARYLLWKEELEKKLQEAREEGRLEAESVAKMSCEQRIAHEREQAALKLQKREELLNEREADIKKRELRQQTAELLSEKGLPMGLLDVIDYSGQEARDQSLKTVEEAFRLSVQAGIEQRLKSNSLPQRAVKSGGDYDSMTDEMYYASTYKTVRQ